MISESRFSLFLDLHYQLSIINPVTTQYNPITRLTQRTGRIRKTKTVGLCWRPRNPHWIRSQRARLAGQRGGQVDQGSEGTMSRSACSADWTEERFARKRTVRHPATGPGHGHPHRRQAVSGVLGLDWRRRRWCFRGCHPGFSSRAWCWISSVLHHYLGTRRKRRKNNKNKNKNKKHHQKLNTLQIAPY